MSRRHLWLGSALTVTLVLAGCDRADISPEAGARLEVVVDEAWDAARGGDAETSAGHLDRLRDEVSRLLEAGDLGEPRAEDILLAADHVEALLVLLEEPEDEAVTDEEPVDEPEPAPDEEGDEEEGGRGGKGKGKGQGKGQGR